jgi:hypothetical protein
VIEPRNLIAEPTLSKWRKAASGALGQGCGRIRSAGVGELGMHARVLQEPGRPRGTPRTYVTPQGRRVRSGPGCRLLRLMTVRSEQEALTGYGGMKKKMPLDGREESELASSTVEAGEPDRWDPGEGRRQWSERPSGVEDVRDIEPAK